MGRLITVLSLLVLLTLWSQSDVHNYVQDSTATTYFPANDFVWESVSPNDLGWDASALAHAVTFAAEHRSTALVVLYNGRIVVEKYWQLENPRTFTRLRDGPAEERRNAEGHPVEDVGSVQKGILGILVGLAQNRSLVDLDAPVSQYLGRGWTQATLAQERRITVRHLMSMSSGLSRAFLYEAEANARWYYNTQVYSRLFDVLTAISGQDPHEYTQAWLSEPLGLRDTNWALRDGGPNPYGLTTSARDLARMGLLMLNQGLWEGQRLMNEEFVQLAFNSSQLRNPAYGLLWWVNGKNRWDDWTNRGMRSGAFIPTGPDDLIAARGIGDRKIYVVPSLGVVVSRLGGFARYEDDGEPDRQFFDHEFWRLFRQALP